MIKKTLLLFIALVLISCQSEIEKNEIKKRKIFTHFSKNSVKIKLLNKKVNDCSRFWKIEENKLPNHQSEILLYDSSYSGYPISVIRDFVRDSSEIKTAAKYLSIREKQFLEMVSLMKAINCYRLFSAKINCKISSSDFETFEFYYQVFEQPILKEQKEIYEKYLFKFPGGGMLTKTIIWYFPEQTMW